MPSETPNKAPVRLPWIDWLKSFGIILVMLGHTEIYGPVKIWIYSFHMPLFFVISGLLLSPKSIDQSPGNFFRTRIRRNITLYVISGIIGAFFFGFVSKFSRSISSPPLESIGYKLLAIAYGSGTINGRLCLFPGVLWFFPALITGLFFSYLIIKFSNGPARVILTVASGIFAALLTNTSLPWEIESGLAATSLIVLGYQLAQSPRVLRRIAQLPWPVKLAIFLLGSVLALQQSKLDFRASDFGILALSLPACMLIILGLMSLCMNAKEFKIIGRIATASVYIFPMHTLLSWVLDSGLRFAAPSHADIWDKSQAWSIIMPAMSLCIFLLTYPVFERLTNIIVTKNTATALKN